MKIDNIANSYLYFIKEAVKDYPEWIPEHFKEVLEPVEKIEKDTRMINFRVEAPSNLKVEEPYLDTLIASVRNQFSEQINYFIYYYVGKNSGNVEINEIIKKHEKKLADAQQLMQMFLALNYNIKKKVVLENKISVGKQELKFSKFYGKIEKTINDVKKEINSVGETTEFPLMQSFDTLPGKQEWDSRLISKKFYIVFTTKYQDILGMSSRSEWKSCQNIRPGSDWDEDPHYALGVLGSCLSKYVGIIYLTDGSNYEGRGERMICRTTVWLVRNEEGTDVLFLQHMYPREIDDINTLFIEALKSNINMSVLESKAGLKRYYERFPEGSHKPYDDKGLGVYYSQEDLFELAQIDPYQYFKKMSPENQEILFYKFYKNGKLRDDPSIIEFANPKWREYKLYVILAANKGPYYMRYFDENWDDYKNLVIGATSKHPEALMICLNYWKKDWPEYKLKVLETFDKFKKEHLLNHYGYNEKHLLKFFDPNWEESKQIIMNGLKQHPLDYIRYVNIKWEGVPELLLNLCEKYNLCDYAKEEWGDLYRQIILKSIKIHGSSYLDYIDKNWEGAKEVIISAIKKQPSLITYADPDWDEYIDLIIFAIKSDKYNWRRITNKLKTDKQKEVRQKLLNRVEECPDMLKIIGPDNYKDTDIVLKALKKNKELISKLNYQWFDKDIIKNYIIDLLVKEEINPDIHLISFKQDSYYDYRRLVEMANHKKTELSKKPAKEEFKPITSEEFEPVSAEELNENK